MRFTKTVKRNIRRTPYQALAASMIMFVTFLSMLLFILLAFGSEAILKHFESKPQVIAFFKDDTSTQDINAIAEALRKTGKVTSIKHISKEEALQIYKDRNKNDPRLTELVTANILPESLEVSTETPQDLRPVAEMLMREPVIGQDNVVIPEDVVAALTRITGIVRFAGVVIVAFLTFFSFLVILMVIGFKIRIRRTEIEIMKLLGASSWFIRAPFIWEGITYGLIGAVSAWIASYVVMWYITPFVQGNIPEVPLLPISPLIMLALLGIVILASFLIGFLGSYGALRRYLKL